MDARQNQAKSPSAVMQNAIARVIAFFSDTLQQLSPAHPLSAANWYSKMPAFSQPFWGSIGLHERGGHFSQPMSTTAKLKKRLTHQR
ncbi:hypothetical protein N9Q74_00140 [Ascidiaceihabitans sp.]|nr:hypothetical protein [Ascidiaceihabitans sp.]